MNNNDAEHGEPSTVDACMNYPNAVKRARNEMIDAAEEMEKKLGELSIDEMIIFLRHVGQLLKATQAGLLVGGDHIVPGHSQHPDIDGTREQRTNALHAREHMAQAAELLDQAGQLVAHASHALQWHPRKPVEGETST